MSSEVDVSDIVDVSSEDETENSMNDLITRMMDNLKHEDSNGSKDFTPDFNENLKFISC